METSWFMMSRIKKAENYKSFQKDAAQALKQHSKRKKAAEKAVETKKRKTLNKVQERINNIKVIFSPSLRTGLHLNQDES